VKLLELTLSTPRQNLALDEALLERLEQQPARECLRLWESPQSFVVLGRSSPISVEVDQEYCRQSNIQILRRASGGQSVVAGPGCLMYAVVLDLRIRPELRMVDRVHQYVLSRLQLGLKRLGIDCQVSGTSDLTIGPRKFSGNSLRCRKNAVLYHGTLLYDFPIEFIQRCLRRPVRQPDYRADRSHESFLMNLPVSVNDLRQVLTEVWNAEGAEQDVPQDLVNALAEEKYGSDEWTNKVLV
jgi:lipoate---protein ligase